MDVELAPAVAAGLIGGLVMLLVQLVASSQGRAFDVAAMWSRFLGLEGYRLVGLLVHVALSVAIAVVYAIGFRVAGASDAGWAWGVTGGLLHWVIAGSFLDTVPGDDGRADERPGPFAMRRGPQAAVGFFVGHLAYGLTIGVVYFSLHTAGGPGSAI